MIDTVEILKIILYKSQKGYVGNAVTPRENIKVVMIPSRKRKEMWLLFAEAEGKLEWIGTAFINLSSKVPIRYGNQNLTYLGSARIKGVEHYDFEVMMDKKGRILIV